MKRFLARSRYSRLLLSFLFVFVEPTEQCSLEDFSSPWSVVVAGIQTFQKKGKRKKFFDDVKWMLT
jgi:hypothetical protein